MNNTTSSASLRGLCPKPFYDASKFGTGGFVEGRFCAPVTVIKKGLYCCLPCPLTDYIYPPEFKRWYRAAEILNVVSLACLVFLLLSFTFLPVQKTHRHYLSYCLILAATLMALGFVIPFGTKPQQCYDQITPNDMYSDLTCAFSGAFLVAGGVSISVWTFVRALSMHLQICWDVLPGKRFFYWSQGLGWSIAAAIFTSTITITGVSFRFGDVCHVNASQSMKDLWGPLLVIAGVATVIQIATFAYCIKVYLRHMFSDDNTDTVSSAGLPSYTNSVSRRSARAVYRRVRKVLWLQWRSITIVIFVLVDVTFFSIVFIWLNSITSHAFDHLDDLMPYLYCLMSHADEPSPCFHLGQGLAINQSTVVAVLIMLSIVGIQCWVLLVRWDMFTGWVGFVKSKFSRNREFVSLDAHNPRNYELKKIGPNVIRVPESAAITPAGTFRVDTPDYFSKEADREYSPPQNFSTPHRQTQVEWDPRSSYARGGLGLHPPTYDTKI